MNLRKLNKWCVPLIGLLLSFSSFSFAQIGEVEEVTPRKIRLSLSYTNINNTGPRLLAKVRTKIDKSYKSVKGAEVRFYFGEKDESNFLGSMKTNENGEVLFLVPETLRKTIDTTDVYLYTAAINGDPTIIDKETDVEIIRSKTSLETITEDSIKKIRFTILAADSAGILQPVADLDPVFYVERLFGYLPISDDLVTTNEKGIAEIEFPENIPGDYQGNVKIIVKLDDHDDFGTLEGFNIVDWGIPNIQNDKIQARELWSSRSNSPLYLIVIVNVLVFGIWIVIGYIIYNLYRIKKLSYH